MQIRTATRLAPLALIMLVVASCGTGTTDTSTDQPAAMERTVEAGEAADATTGGSAFAAADATAVRDTAPSTTSELTPSTDEGSTIGEEPADDDGPAKIGADKTDGASKEAGSVEGPNTGGAYGDDPILDALWDECDAGDGQACDELYYESALGSEYEEFGYTCGGRGVEFSCASPGTGPPDPSATAYGDDANLDALWDECAAGDGDACDSLYYTSPVGSEYEEFGNTCGGRGFQLSCGAGSDEAGSDGGSYGDNPVLDALWDACAAGDGAACDELYYESPFGSEYEEFGNTCGGRGFELSCA